MNQKNLQTRREDITKDDRRVSSWLNRQIKGWKYSVTLSVREIVEILFYVRINIISSLPKKR